jgi:hypothetical protein
VLGGAVSVVSTGAVGNNLADDSEAIQTAVAANNRVEGEPDHTYYAGGVVIDVARKSVAYLKMVGWPSNQFPPTPYKETGISLLTEALQSIWKVSLDRYNVVGIGIKNNYGVTIFDTEVKAVNNPDSPTTLGYGVDYGYDGSTFNNANKLIGGKIHTCDVGVRAKNANYLDIDTIVEGNQYAAVHVETSDLIRMPRYTELNNTTGGNYDIEFLLPPNYSRFSRLCSFQNSYFAPKEGKKLALIQAAYCTVIENCIVGTKNGKDQNGVEGRITLGAGAINTHARNNVKIIIEDLNGAEVRPEFDGEIEGNLFKHSEAIDNAAWGAGGQVNFVENVATDGATFLDGSAPMRVNFKATLTADTSSGGSLDQVINDSAKQYHGKVLGWGVWVRSKAGQTMNMQPVLRATTQYTGDNFNSPLVRRITDSWQFVSYNGAIDNTDTLNDEIIGWTFWPTAGSTKNGDGTCDVYLRYPRAWSGALEHIGYVPTTTARRLPRLKSQAAPVIAGNAEVTTLPASSVNVIYAAPITANRTVTLNTTAVAGDTVTVTRESSATGAFTVSVNGLMTLDANRWATAVYSGSAWGIASSGTVVP